MFSKKVKFGYILFYLLVIIILALVMKEALWRRKLDIEYKQAIIELKEREDFKL